MHRLLEDLGDEFEARKVPAILAKEIAQVIDAEGDKKLKSVAIAYSGDSGFYSGCRSLLPLLEGKGAEVQVLPGISSVQMLSARLQRPWHDWNLFSAHGVDCSAVTALLKGKPAYFLTGGALKPKNLCMELTEAGLGDHESQ